MQSDGLISGTGAAVSSRAVRLRPSRPPGCGSWQRLPTLAAAYRDSDMDCLINLLYTLPLAAQESHQEMLTAVVLGTPQAPR